MTIKPRAPIIKELYFSKEQIATVKSIQKTGIITKRKDSIRSVLDGLPLCCICSLEVPTRKVEYDSGRLETYCDEHFSIYERNKDVDIQQIAESFNCTIAEPGDVSKVKVEGYNEGYSRIRPKSSLADRTIICSRCRVTRIFFDNTQRGHNNLLIPLEYKYSSAFRPHDCDCSFPFFCVHEGCNTKCYYDRKVRNLRGGLIAMEFETDLPHECKGKERND